MTYTPHPLRIQRKRTKGWRMPEGAVYIGRPSRWGNRLPSAKWFREWLEEGRHSHTYAISRCCTIEQVNRRRKLILEDIPCLRGKVLCCWCRLDQPCHGDVLAELANKDNDK